MAMGMGRGMGRELLQQVAQASLATELLYSFIIIAISLMIYFGTRELYNLSSHKGIKYFRQAFLFFAIAFFFRSFIKFLFYFFDAKEIFGLQGIGILSFFVFLYASSMAIFYLLMSVMWKKWAGDKIIWLHLLAVIIAFVAFIAKSALVILLIHIVLFVFIAIVTFISYKDSKKKKHNLHGIYLLLFAFWIFNILDLIINSFQAFQLSIYVASTTIFLAILYKVLRRIG